MKNTYKLLLKGAIIISVAGVLAGCGGKSNIQPPAKLVQYQPTAKIKAAWTNGVGNGSDGEYLTLSPTISDGVAYTVSYGGDVVATSIQNGRTIWRSDLDVALGATPAVGQDEVFVGSIHGKLFALNKKTGKVNWSTVIASSLFSKPAYADGSVIVYTHDGTIAAFNAKTGKQQWTQNIVTSSLMLTGNSTPLIQKGTVYVGFDNGELWAFNLKTGEKLWDKVVALPSGSAEVSRMVDIISNPVIEDGVLYAGSYQGNLLAIDLASGRDIWTRKFSTYTNLAVNQGMIFITNAKGYVMALDKQSGQTIWEQKILKGRSVTGPTVLGNYVIVADFEGYVHAFDRETGKYADRDNVGGNGIRATPVESQNKVYVQTNSGRLVALTIHSI
ncbi:outer membrane protein assembly factor BamB [Francisellaceae bacterium]|nr:outer membrane protein assembly factor BamB [Francisellaceae bacterium]